MLCILCALKKMPVINKNKFQVNKFMRTAFLKIITIILIPSCIYTGCFLSTKENINKLPDKKFYFSEFDFVLPGQTREEAYFFFKDFPVKKIMFMLATEYNITVDISDYNNFIRSKRISSIETDGSVRVVTNRWKKKNTETNRIKIIFEQDYLDSSKRKFSLAIYSGNTTLKLFNSDIVNIDHIIEKLQSHLQTGNDSLKEFETKNYGKVSPIPLIIDIEEEVSGKAEPSNLIKIKEMIDEYVKTLDQNKKNEFKHDLIDFIYKKCN